jgi:hypothetical protein
MFPGMLYNSAKVSQIFHFLRFSRFEISYMYIRGVIKTKPEYACKFVIFVIQELLTKDQIFRWPLSTNFSLIKFLSENLVTKQIV